MKRNPPRRALPLLSIVTSLTKRITPPLWLAIVFIGVSFGFANAQEGAIDPAFDVPFTSYGTGELPGSINALALQPDGKLLVGGGFVTIGGKTRVAIARLNANGTADTTFESRLSTLDVISRIAIDNQGRIFIAGTFRHLGGIPRSGFARLRTDGGLDTSFTPPAGVQDFAVDLLGRVYVTGAMISDGANSREGIARLNPDGSLDSTFTAEIPSESVVLKALTDSQNRVVVFGDFPAPGGIVRRGVVRLNPDGTRDQTFSPYLALKGARFDDFSFQIAVDPVGRILLAPRFSTSNRLLRLNLNGTPDTTFTPPGLSSIGTMTFQPNGKIVLSSSFSSNPIFLRLNIDGSPDNTFTPPPIQGDVRALISEPTGRILFGGALPGIENQATLVGSIGRLNVDGILDTTFLVSDRAPGQVLTMAKDSSGRILAGGRFTSCGTYQIPNLARINANGTVDTTFRPFRIPTAPLEPIPSVFSVALDANGKILVAGDFRNIGGIPRNGIARLNGDGSVDQTFNPGIGVGQVSNLKVSLDGSGKIYLGGPFTSFGGVNRAGLVRLNPDGSVDTSFVPSAGGVGFVVDGNGHPVVATADNTLVRLNADGSNDGSFQSALSFVSGVELFISSGNKILVGGAYRVAGGPTSNGIIRLNSDGSVDSGFNGATNPNATIKRFAPDPNGKLLVDLSNPASNSTDSQLLRLNADGSLDTNFQPASLQAPGVFAIGFDGTGNPLLSVAYQLYEGTPRASLIRLTTNPCRASVAPLNENFQANGGTGTISFTTPTNTCAWSAQSDAPWISITAAGNGSAAISYSIAPNNTGPRTGYIRVNGQVVTVTQEAGCAFSVTPPGITLNEFGGTGTFNISCSSECVWKIEYAAPWIRLLSPPQGQGNATIQYQALPNPGGTRSVIIVVGGTGSFTVSQRGRSVPTAGSYRASSGFVYLRNSTDTGIADREFFYGQAADIPVSGDWDGDGGDSVGIYRNGAFFLKNANSSGFADVQFPYGQPGDIPIAGDWDGDGVDTIGVIRGNRVLLRNSNSAGPADIDFNYGADTDIFIAGDWNGDGIDTIGAYRQSNGFVYLRNSNTSGFADTEFFYGLAGDRPIAGDWDGDGIDTIGVVRGNRWLLRNSNTSGFADIDFNFGADTDIPIVGDWDGTP